MGYSSGRACGLLKTNSHPALFERIHPFLPFNFLLINVGFSRFSEERVNLLDNSQIVLRLPRDQRHLEMAFTKRKEDPNIILLKCIEVSVILLWTLFEFIEGDWGGGGGGRQTERKIDRDR